MIVSRCFILPPEQGADRRSPDRGANAVSQLPEFLSCHMTQTANPVTLASYGQAPLGLEGSGAFRRPGSIVRAAHRTMGSAHRAGWFRGEFYMPLPGAAKTIQPGFAQGGRRLAVRTAMEHPTGALPRTPFPASRDFPSRGNEKIGGTGYCVTYDTDSQSRNVLASPLGEKRATKWRRDVRG